MRRKDAPCRLNSAPLSRMRRCGISARATFLHILIRSDINCSDSVCPFSLGRPADHADDELLLQIKGDRILGWFPTVGCVLQFWIDRKSLAARDFNAAQATMDCD